MTRLAISARYSSDLQKPTSIEDQVRLCREWAEQKGFEVVGVYPDYALSGTTLHNRDGIKNLMRDAAENRFDVVVAEGMDRFSRDQEDIAGLYKRLQFMRVKMFTLAEGEITPLHIGMKGTMNALFITDLAAKVRRGQRGRVENGKIGGGNGYGYDVVKRFDERGNPVRGERTINEAHARIIRRIFAMYVAGASPKAIAARLNFEGVPGPGKKGWSQSTINGNWQRGSGILNNEMYVGVIAWNKVRYDHHPETGRHAARPNPESTWIRKEVPDLRILDQQVWDKAKARQRRGRQSRKGFWEHQRPRYLLSQLLRCGCCGGSYSKISEKSYGCAAARNKGNSVCSNRRVIARADLEHTVLETLKRNLMDPILLAEFCKEYTAHVNRLRIEHNASLTAYRAELDRLAREEDRLFKAVTEGYANAAGARRSREIESRRQELVALVADTNEAPVLLHPVMAKRYQEEVTALVRSLNDQGHRHEAAELIRSLIDHIVLSPNPAGPGLLIDLFGDLAGILNIATKEDRARGKQEVDLKQIRMVVGLEPPTLREKVKDMPPGEQVPDLAIPDRVKLVPRRGLEPPLLAEHGPEPCASTNSAIWAAGADVCGQGAGVNAYSWFARSAATWQMPRQPSTSFEATVESALSR